MNWAAILAAARRAQAAYVSDAAGARQAFEALGLTFLGQYQNGSHQAVLTCDANGAVYLSISGTRFSQWKFGDLLEDVDIDPLDLGGGALVTSGAYEGLEAMWAWALSLAPVGCVFNVEGHSLGAWRARYTPCFLPAARIGALHGFESPKGANATFWGRYADELAGMVHVVHGRDVFVAWPLVGGWQHPDADHLWLTGDGFQVIRPAQWPGPRVFSDHSIDTIVERIAAIANAGAATPA